MASGARAGRRIERPLPNRHIRDPAQFAVTALAVTALAVSGRPTLDEVTEPF
jgi:hypothetical protein